jgi:hypothetical protein
MPTIYQQIVEKFLRKLVDSGDVDSSKIEKLKVVLSQNVKIKADDFVKIFNTPAGEDLK